MSTESTITAEEMDPHSWQVLSDAVRRLESAWRTESTPEVSDFLVAGPAWLRNRILIELIKVDQECAWQRGIRRMTEDYFSRWPELASHEPTCLELVRAECLTRCVFDEPPTSAEIRTRFSAIFDLLSLTDITVQAAGENSRRNEIAVETSIFPEVSTPQANSRAQDEAEIATRIGTTLGRYQIRGSLGHGGMGIVYRAWDPRLSREVALKIPRFDPAHASEIAERFMREATSAAQIRHRSICPIHDFGVVEGTHFLVMELVSGQSLERLLRKSPLSPRRAAMIAAKLARALECIHNAGLLHRDVSASNVIIDTEGEPVLMDFGLARAADTPTVAPHCSGTPAYMAPETFAENQRVVDLRADVFSLGVLCYQMLTGHLPQGADKSRLVSDGQFRMVLPSTITPAVDKRLEAICLRAMAPHPAKRYQSAAEFADALDEYLNSLPDSDRSRNRWLVGSTLGIIGLGTIVLWNNWGEPLAGSRSDTNPIPSTAAPIRSQMADFSIRDDLLAERAARSKADLDFIRAQLVAHPRLSGDPADERVVEFRRRLVSFLRSEVSDDLAVEAASILALLPWPKVDDSPNEAVFWNRMPRIDNPSIPVDPGVGVHSSDGQAVANDSGSHANPNSISPPDHIKLAPGGSVIVRGRIQPNWKHNQFRLWIDDPVSFRYRIISLTRSYEVLVDEQWHGGSNTEATDRSGHRLYQVQDVLPQPQNWHSFRINRVKGSDVGVEGDYLLFIWQPDRKEATE